MNQHLIFLPLLLQVALTLLLYIKLGQAKEQAVKAGTVDQARRPLHDDAWPDSVQKINNNIRNQFETPVLFYVLILVLWSIDSAGIVPQTVAWAYASCRVLHAWVHTGSNNIRLRKRLFQASVVLLFVLSGITLFSLFL